MKLHGGEMFDEEKILAWILSLNENPDEFFKKARKEFSIKFKSNLVEEDRFTEKKVLGAITLYIKLSKNYLASRGISVVSESLKNSVSGGGGGGGGKRESSVSGGGGGGREVIENSVSEGDAKELELSNELSNPTRLATENYLMEAYSFWNLDATKEHSFNVSSKKSMGINRSLFENNFDKYLTYQNLMLKDLETTEKYAIHLSKKQDEYLEVMKENQKLKEELFLKASEYEKVLKSTEELLFINSDLKRKNDEVNLEKEKLEELLEKCTSEQFEFEQTISNLKKENEKIILANKFYLEQILLLKESNENLIKELKLEKQLVSKHLEELSELKLLIIKNKLRIDELESLNLESKKLLQHRDQEIQILKKENEVASSAHKSLEKRFEEETASFLLKIEEMQSINSEKTTVCNKLLRESEEQYNNLSSQMDELSSNFDLKTKELILCSEKLKFIEGSFSAYKIESEKESTSKELQNSSLAASLKKCAEELESIKIELTKNRDHFTETLKSNQLQHESDVNAEDLKNKGELNELTQNLLHERSEKQKQFEFNAAMKSEYAATLKLLTEKNIYDIGILKEQVEKLKSAIEETHKTPLLCDEHHTLTSLALNSAHASLKSAEISFTESIKSTIDLLNDDEGLLNYALFRNLKTKIRDELFPAIAKMLQSIHNTKKVLFCPLCEHGIGESKEVLPELVLNKSKKINVGGGGGGGGEKNREDDEVFFGI